MLNTSGNILKGKKVPKLESIEIRKNALRCGMWVANGFVKEIIDGMM